MKSKSPEVFLLTATRESNPSDVVQELFFRSTYQHDSDRMLEASNFAERMIERGYKVQYSESEWVDRI